MMPGPYTDYAGRVLAFAREEALGSGARTIGSAHVLLGLLRHGKGLSALLVRDGLSEAGVRERVRSSAPAHGDLRHAGIDIPMAEDARRALASASQAADRLNQASIATHHLLLGLLADEDSSAAAILRAHGIDVASLREEVDGILFSLQQADGRPDWPASHDVRIGATRLTLDEGTRSSAGPDYWTHRGFDLRSLVADAFRVDPARIDWPVDLDRSARYDIGIHLPEHEDPNQIDRLLQDAIRRHFHLVIEHETRDADVYVLTAADDPGANRVSAGAGGGGLLSAWTGSWNAADAPPAVREFLRRLADTEAAGGDGVPAPSADVLEFLRNELQHGDPRHPTSLSGTTDIDHLCRMLGSMCHRPVVDETGLTDPYAIEVRHDGTSFEDFVQALREQAGLVMAAARREIPMLAVRREPRADV